MLGDVLCYDCKYVVFDDAYEDEFGCSICICTLHTDDPNSPEASNSWHKCDKKEKA